MNDPHVTALHYRIKHAPGVDFEKAAPLKHDKEPGFSVRIENGKAEIVMKKVHRTVDSALAAVEPFLSAWELSWGLGHASDRFRFEFLWPDLIDRNPTPAHGVHFIQGRLGGAGSMRADNHHSRAKYPNPPQGLGWSDEVDLMFERYRRVSEQRTTLNDGANFCLTVLEFGAAGLPVTSPARVRKRRQKAEAHFKIALPVLNKIGELAAEKGGRTESRKHEGARKPFTPAERAWLEKALKLLIRRAAEVAHDTGAARAGPKPSRSPITMADLPQI
jgi:hypothetical protein